MDFYDLDLDDKVLDALDAMRFSKCTPIQEKTIPLILEGHDVMGIAQTGTGKTAAYLLPIINNLYVGNHPKDSINCIIMSPTRELAQQIDQAMEGFSYFVPVSSVAVYGGNDGVRYEQERKSLQLGADVIIATPGRLISHIQLENPDFSQVSFFVLDEADRMLDMGFIHDVTRILDKIPSRRNLGMFSATISREVMDISWVYQRDPEEITVRADEQNKPDILQYAVTVEQTDKVAAMARIIRQEKLERVMVFCNTKGMVERLTKYLEMEGLDAACIHGDIPQKKREQVMARFRRGELPVFVATDVAARGIDVDDVDAVFNYDVPQENEYYVHRIGRTGRAKRHGVAYTLVADYPSKMRLDAIAKFTGNDVKPAHFEGDTLVVDAK